MAKPDQLGQNPWMTISSWRDRLGSARSPLVIAHRGDSFRAPENTLEAARLGFQSGAFAWELDVHLSRDGVPVVIHDESLLRTTNVAEQFASDPRSLSGFLVSQFLLEEIQSLDAGSWFLSETGGSRSALGFESLDRVPSEVVERCRSGSIRVPSLHEALQFTRDCDWRVNIEIKSFPNPNDSIVSAVLTEVESLGISESILISSFNHDDVAEVCRLAPRIATGLLVDQPLFRPERYLRDVVGADCYHTSGEVAGAVSDRYRDHPSSETLRAGPLRGLLDNHCPILIYTVNDANPGGLADHLAELGVSAIFTDDPEQLVALFRKPRNSP